MLKEIFDKVLEKERPKRPTPTEPIFKIKPSILGSKCQRQIFYSATGVPEDVPFPLVAKKRMKLGDAIHIMLEDVFQEAGILVKYKNPDGTIPKDHDGNDNFEFPLQAPELFIKLAYIDAVYIIDGKLWLGEYKSINVNGFRDLTSPKLDHLIQGVSYLYIFNKMLQEGAFSHIQELNGFSKAEGIRYLYVCKDDTSMAEFAVTNADNTFESIVNKILTIKHFADNNILPPCTPDWGRTCNCNWKIKSKNNVLK
jgi:hypothetical protein